VRVRRPGRAGCRGSARVAGGQEPRGGRACRGTLRYRLLETIRLFAAERLVEAGDDGEAAAVAAAHCTHFLSVAEQAAVYLTGPEKALDLALPKAGPA
jgi:predicted ATPase